MTLVRVGNKKKPENSPILVKKCTSFTCKLTGLMFQKQIAIGSGLLMIYNSNSRLDTAIHMMGVCYDLAVFWINKDKVVVDKCRAKRFWPIYISRRPACYVLEMNINHIDDFEIGDQVMFMDME